MSWMAEPWMDAERHQAELDRIADRYPRCDVCGQTIWPGACRTMFEGRYGMDTVCDSCLTLYLDGRGWREDVWEYDEEP